MKTVVALLLLCLCHPGHGDCPADCLSCSNILPKQLNFNTMVRSMNSKILQTLYSPVVHVACNTTIRRVNSLKLFIFIISHKARRLPHKNISHKHNLSTGVFFKMWKWNNSLFSSPPAVSKSSIYPFGNQLLICCESYESNHLAFLSLYLLVVSFWIMTSLFYGILGWKRY